MADLDDIYNLRILELAANIPRSQRLERPDATASAHSKLCGSTISIDLNVEDGRIVDFAQTVKACLLGQASAAIVGREIVGTTADEFRVRGRRHAHDAEGEWSAAGRPLGRSRAARSP